MSLDQAVNLSFGREMRRRRVSRIQPSSSLHSSIAPSAFNLFGEMIALRGIGSWSMIGRQNVWIARGIAASNFEPITMPPTLKRCSDTTPAPTMSMMVERAIPHLLLVFDALTSSSSYNIQRDFSCWFVRE